MLQVVPDGDPDQQEALCREAWALGRRHGDVDLECEAEGYVGLMLVQSGRVEEGMVLFDEVLAAICAGEVRDVYVVEGCICGMFLACERANDVVRAEQWLRTAEDVVRRPHMVGVSAFCRAHYGGILTAAGRRAEAEAELTGAARRLDQSYPGMRSAALVRLADLRVRQSRCEEAEQADCHRQRDEHVTSMYELTSELATQEPLPGELEQLLTAAAGSKRAMDAFAEMFAGVLPVPAFFAPEHVERILRAAA